MARVRWGMERLKRAVHIGDLGGMRLIGGSGVGYRKERRKEGKKEREKERKALLKGRLVGRLVG